MTFYRFIWWIAYAVAALLFRVRVEGRQNIPSNGGFVVAINHCSYVDPVIIGVAAGRELWYLAKAELFSVPGLGWLIRNLNAMPVDRRRGDRSAIMTWTQLLRAGRPVLIFPEGTRNKKPGFLKPRPGIGMLVHRTQVPVLPAYISGTTRIWKTVLGLDRLTVRFGKPIQFCADQLPERRKDAYYFISKQVMLQIGKIGQAQRKAGAVAPAERIMRR
ncbi:MAG: 1-acyl-sn-glycerol-3-phosphate acyltransferase [Candidatus Latescibacteria bacterium]|nr:1-acyl-sn-glycerol-3-phosphate acyltransferase [Candidatus Latescibacterota bacterium]MBT5831714.1 1-acyl-sn-glycerol-3-phosphate acyltransferase [Candidatus Latescibacterota bacterium]